MPAHNLHHAIELANQSGYGLTSGLESLDKREQHLWKERIFAGNLYINRGTTGAIVLRQPFGGFGQSSLGSGIKAGSPEYVSQFMHCAELTPPRHPPLHHHHRLLSLLNEWRLLPVLEQGERVALDIEQLICATKSYLYQMETYFGVEHDYYHLRGQDNLIRFLPVSEVIIRLHAEDGLFDALARIAAATFAGCTVNVSIPKEVNPLVRHFLTSYRGEQFLAGTSLRVEEEKDLAVRIKPTDRIRYAGPKRVSKTILQAAAQKGATILRNPVFMEGRLELPHYLRQQTVCHNYHRYGNLGNRAINNI
jgi:RHH-type proline utilization regulon transcriptional repressor/proline dehydrogenase/delta 1-pyrroline-5-carboxylate dehydrogenase